MKKLTLLLFTFLSTLVLAQIKFEKGKITKSNGEVIEVYIRNTDQKRNPENVKYKTALDSEIITLSLNEIRDFKIENSNHFVKEKVMIDISDRSLNNMSYDNNPKLVEKTLLLRVLVLGNHNLYQYTNGNDEYFFYKNGEVIEQLIYKPYRVETNKVAYNKTYRSQILKNIPCEIVTKEKLMSVDYKQNDLLNLFIAINKCNDADYVYVEKNIDRKIKFDLNIRPRLNINSLKMNTNVFEYQNVTFDKQASFVLGLEAEFILPFNKNKWAIIVEPNYLTYTGENENKSELTDITTKRTLDYKVIDIPLGVRHYMFLNDKSKIFINGQYVRIFSLDSNINVFRNNQKVSTLEIGDGSNFSFGAGYKFMDRYSIEARYTTDVKRKEEYSNNYKMISFILGYKIF